MTHRRPVRLAAASVAIAIASFALGVQPAAAAGTPAYDSIPAVLSGSAVSLGYQATFSTAELGDLVQLAGTDRRLEDVRIGFVDWACETGTGTVACATTPGTGFDHPITVNIYAAGTAPLPGSLLATVTQTVTVPFRPSADAVNCTGADAGKWYSVPDSECVSGLLFTASFDLGALDVELPDEVIVAVAFNTRSYGTAPIGSAGPYDSFNVALNESLPPTVGVDLDDDSVYWNTSFAGNYTDGGTAGVGVLAEDTNWTPYSLMLTLNTSPVIVAPAASGAALPTMGVNDSAVLVGAVALLTVLVGLTLLVGRRSLRRS